MRYQQIRDVISLVWKAVQLGEIAFCGFDALSTERGGLQLPPARRSVRVEHISAGCARRVLVDDRPRHRAVPKRHSQHVVDRIVPVRPLSFRTQNDLEMLSFGCVLGKLSCDARGVVVLAHQQSELRSFVADVADQRCLNP